MKFLVLSEHSNSPEGSADVSELINEDLRKGIFKDWGAFAGFGKGFLILDVKDESQAFKETQKYSKFGVRFLSAQLFLTLPEVERIF